MTVLSEEAVSEPEARNILEEKSTEEGAIYEQKLALDHLKKNVQMDPDSVEDLREELEGIDQLKPEHVALVINICPTEPEEVETLFNKEHLRLDDDDRKAITDAVRKYA